MSEAQTHNQPEVPAGEYRPGVDADINVSAIVTVGAVGTALLVFAIVFLQALYYWEHNRETAAKATNAFNADFQRSRADELNLLQGYAWRDARQGVIRIPIELAEQEVLAAAGRWWISSGAGGCCRSGSSGSGWD